MRTAHNGLALLTLLSLAACRPRAESPEAAMARQTADQKAAEEAIALAQASFVLHYNSGHPDSLAAFYLPDAHLMPSNLPAVVGTAAIQAAYTQALASKGQLKLVTESVSASGDLAVERGTYEETYTPPGSSTSVTERGKYLAHWQRIDGKWLMVDHIANSDLPVSGAVPPVP